MYSGVIYITTTAPISEPTAERERLGTGKKNEHIQNIRWKNKWREREIIRLSTV